VRPGSSMDEIVQEAHEGQGMEDSPNKKLLCAFRATCE